MSRKARNKLSLIAVISALFLSISQLSAMSASAKESTFPCESVDLAVWLDPEKKPKNFEEINRTPVVFVHGLEGRSINSRDTKSYGNFSGPIIYQGVGERTLEESEANSLIESIQQMPNAAAYTFDYNGSATEWVTNENISPALARAIKCLADQSGRQVIVVAHSMGGLATRQALSDAEAAQKTSKVITFGTPNEGTYLFPGMSWDNGPALVKALAKYNTSYQMLALQLLLGARGQIGVAVGFRTDKGGGFPNPFSQAAKALGFNSPELKALPAWPEGLSVSVFGSNITSPAFGWFGIPNPSDMPSTVEVGDTLVGKTSALGTAANSRILECNVDPVVTAKSIFTGKGLEGDGLDRCYHGDLMQSVELTSQVIAEVREAVRLKSPTLSCEQLLGKEEIDRFPAMNIEIKETRENNPPSTTCVESIIDQSLGGGRGLIYFLRYSPVTQQEIDTFVANSAENGYYSFDYDGRTFWNLVEGVHDPSIYFNGGYRFEVGTYEWLTKALSAIETSN